MSANMNDELTRGRRGLRIGALALRTAFIGSLVALVMRVSSPQNETFWSAYDTPGDLIRVVLGLATPVSGFCSNLSIYPRTPRRIGPGSASASSPCPSPSYVSSPSGSGRSEQLMRCLTVLRRDVSVRVRARKKKGRGRPQPSPWLRCAGCRARLTHLNSSLRSNCSPL